MIILTDKDLSGYSFGKNVTVINTNEKSLKKFNKNSEVVAIAGSRAMAIKAITLDFPSLKLFQLTSAGFDNVPLEKYKEKNIYLCNAGSTYSIPIAETVVFSMLLMVKKLRKNAKNRRFKLLRHYSEITELADKKVLIMGAGNIGTAIAERLLPFSMHVDGYDPYCAEKKEYKSILRTREQLINEIANYDFVISTMPANDDTKGFINAEIFANMKKTAVVVNVGRKAVFNDKDFYRALKKKQVGGAVLDMFEKLPNPITNKFRRLKNVIVLPGVSAISKEVNIRLKEHMSKNVIKVLEGEKPQNVINGV